jgi:hypothetical protein
MRNLLVTGILVVSMPVVAGCNPFLDRLTQMRGEGSGLHRCGNIEGGGLDNGYVSPVCSPGAQAVHPASRH